MEQDHAEFSLISDQTDEAVISEFPHEWFSIHNRETLNRPIKVCHLLLDFVTPISSSS